MKKNFFIGIPTINRADLLNEALLKYSNDFPDVFIHIVDNGNQDIIETPNTIIHKSKKNYGVAKSWNFLLSSGFMCDGFYSYGLILNDDIYLGKNSDQIQKLIHDHNFPDFLCGTKHWCSFMCSRRIYKKIGGFDENFYPAYFEDNDFAYRLKLNNANRVNTEVLDPEIYRNSQTIAKDPSLNQGFQSNKDYYIRKWGGEPEQERFTTPFNY